MLEEPKLKLYTQGGISDQSLESTDCRCDKYSAGVNSTGSVFTKWAYELRVAIIYYNSRIVMKNNSVCKQQYNY